MSHLTECRNTGEWCGLCYSGLKGRAVYRGHFGYRAVSSKREQSWMACKRRKSQEAGSGDSPSPVAPSDWQKWWPHVFEFLSASTFDDGASRVTGTVMLFQEGGLWKLWVHDRDASEGLFVSAVSPEAAFERLEGYLALGEGDWRPDKKSSRR